MATYNLNISYVDLMQLVDLLLFYYYTYTTLPLSKW